MTTSASAILSLRESRAAIPTRLATRRRLVVTWTQTTLFAAVAVQLAGRRLSIEPGAKRK